MRNFLFLKSSVTSLRSAPPACMNMRLGGPPLKRRKTFDLIKILSSLQRGMSPIETLKVFTPVFILFTLLSLLLTCKAQTTNAYEPSYIIEKDLALFVGYNGWKHHYAEISIGVHKYGGDGHHPFGSGYSLGSEMRAHENFIFSPKISAWMGGGAAGMCLKINALYYTDTKIGRAAIRPEMGIGGFGYFTCVYGFNLYLNKNEMLGLNRHVVSLLIPVRLKRVNSNGYTVITKF